MPGVLNLNLTDITSGSSNSNHSIYADVVVTQSCLCVLHFVCQAGWTLDLGVLQIIMTIDNLFTAFF